MIVLDTNVVSEALKPEPHPAVRTWLNDQASETLYLSSVPLAELVFGIAALPAGRRKDMLAQTLDGLTGLFRNRVLPFDTDAARRYAELAVTSKTGGRGFPTPDGSLLRLRFRGVSSWRHATRPPMRRPVWQSSIRGKHSEVQMAAGDTSVGPTPYWKTQQISRK